MGALHLGDESYGSNKGYFKLLLDGEKGIDSKYVWQIQMNLLVSERKWWDFVAYNPNYKKTIFIHRFLVNEEKQEKLILGLKKGKEMIKNIKEKSNKLI